MSAMLDTSGIAEVARLARAAGRIAYDTEFMGEGRYRTLLCLVQVAVSDGRGGTRIEVIDPLDPAVDASSLVEVLEDPVVEVVVHAGRQDVALVRRWLSCEVRGLFDTQVAAGFDGLPAQASYETLLAEVLGVRLAKSASFTRWDRRPLSEEQVAYAREDVVHLLALADELEHRLQARGRLEWAREESASLEHSSDERDPDALFLRLPRLRSLRGEALGVALELVHWREATASAADRPATSVLADPALLELAKRRPQNMHQLEQIRGLNPSALRRHGRELLLAVERGRTRPAPALEDERRSPPPDPDDAAIVALCEALARARAREAGLAYELLAARSDLQAIVTRWRAGGAPAEVRTLRGWRAELVGEELLALLRGERSLMVGRRRVLARSADGQPAPAGVPER